MGALRSLLVDVYPPSLRAAGLTAALSDAAATLRARGTRVSVDVDQSLDLDHDVQTLIYGVAQECLRNAERHANATAVAVEVGQRDGTPYLAVSDDGVGFDVAEVLTDPAEGHFGLRVMRDLAAHGGGQLSVSSRPGAGTRWKLEVAPRDR